MILQRASDDAKEKKQLVFTPVKNNDGRDEGEPTAWEMHDGQFFEVEEFDWDAFKAESGSKKKGPAVSEELLRKLFEDGTLWLPRPEAVARLELLAGIKRSAAQEALKMVGGRFSAFCTAEITGDWAG